MSTRQQKVVVQPINVIFRYLQRQTRVSLWLYDNVDMRLEGKIIVRAHNFFFTKTDRTTGV